MRCLYFSFTVLLLALAISFNAFAEILDEGSSAILNADTVTDNQADMHVDLEMEIEGTPLEGGMLDDAIDRGESIPSRPIVESGSNDNQNAMDTLVSEVLANIQTMRTRRGLYCNDQKLGVSLGDALSFMVPQSETIAETVSSVVKVVKQLAMSNVVKGGGKGKKAIKDPSSNALSTSGLHNLFHESLEKHLPAYAGLIKSNLQRAGNLGAAVTRMELPVGSLVSDGVFRLSGVSNPQSIRLIQHNYAIINLICSSDLAGYLGPARKALCSCWGRADAANSPTSVAQNRAVNDNYEWCEVDDVCKGVPQGGECIVPVDPFRMACISYNAGGDADIKAGGISASFTNVTYARVVPMVDLQMDISLLGSRLGRWIDSTGVVHKWVRMEWPLQKICEVLHRCSTLLPVYLSRMVGGLWLLQVADDLSTNALFQYCLAAVFGLLLAVIWVVLVIYRTIEGLLKSSSPFFVPGLGIAVLGPLWYAMRLDYLRNMLLTGILEFWDRGWGPYLNAGKIYFGASMVLSVFCKHYFQLFAPKSNSAYVLRTLIKGIGCLLLCYCTSNREVSAVFLMYGLCQEYILYFWFRARLSYEVSQQKSGAQLMGRPYYSVAELEKLTKTTTEVELAKLQKYLQQNPEVAENLQDKLRQGEKGEAATLLGRFARGAYHLASTPLVPGTPGYESDENEETENAEFVDAIDASSANKVAKENRMPRPNKGRRCGSWVVWILGFIAVGAIALITQQHLMASRLYGRFGANEMGKIAEAQMLAAKELATDLIQLAIEKVSR